jgi:hypothetical protein
MVSKRKLLELEFVPNKKIKIEKELKRKFINAFIKCYDISIYRPNKRLKVEKSEDVIEKYKQWRRDILLYL